MMDKKPGMKGLAAKGVKMSKGKGADMVAEVVGILFMSRTYAHMAHLHTSSYSNHIALNDFYDDVLDHADSIAEAAQGKYGKLTIPYIDLVGSVTQPAETLEKHLDMIRKLADGCEGRAINSIVDQIVQLYLEVIYKLRELS